MIHLHNVTVTEFNNKSHFCSTALEAILHERHSEQQWLKSQRIG